jgi:hypothetical protein
MTAPLPNADDFKHGPSRSTSSPQGIRRFIPFVIRRKSQGWQVQIYWKQFAAALVVVGLLGWLGTASAAYLFVKYRRGFSEVKFTHMLLLPAKWDEYEVARGEFLIKSAQRDM